MWWCDNGTEMLVGTERKGVGGKLMEMGSRTWMWSEKVWGEDGCEDVGEAMMKKRKVRSGENVGVVTDMQGGLFCAKVHILDKVLVCRENPETMAKG